MQQSKLTPPSGNAPRGLLKDHLELVALELKYEKKEGLRRLFSWGVGILFLLFSFVYFQIALVTWLLKMDFTWSGIGLISGAVFFVLGISIIRVFGKRKSEGGAPFQGSLDELKRSFEWIRNRFF